MPTYLEHVTMAALVILPCLIVLSIPALAVALLRVDLRLVSGLLMVIGVLLALTATAGVVAESGVTASWSS